MTPWDMFNHEELDVAYNRWRDFYVANPDYPWWRSRLCWSCEGIIPYAYTEEISEITKWVNTKIMMRIDINNDATDRVLLRIVAGMLDKVNIPKEAKIKLHLGLLKCWRTQKLEWKTFQLQKQIKELPF